MVTTVMLCWVSSRTCSRSNTPCLAVLGDVSVVPWGAAGDGDCTAVAAVGRPVCSCGSSSFYAAHHGRDGSLVFSLRT